MSISADERRQVLSAVRGLGWPPDRVDEWERLFTDPDREQLRQVVAALTSVEAENREQRATMARWESVMDRAAAALERFAAVEEGRLDLERQRAELRRTMWAKGGGIVALVTAIVGAIVGIVTAWLQGGTNSGGQ